MPGEMLVWTPGEITQPCRRAFYLAAEKLLDHIFIQPGEIVIIYRRKDISTQTGKLFIRANIIQQSGKLVIIAARRDRSISAEPAAQKIDKLGLVADLFNFNLVWLILL